MSKFSHIQVTLSSSHIPTSSYSLAANIHGLYFSAEYMASYKIRQNEIDYSCNLNEQQRNVHICTRLLP